VITRLWDREKKSKSSVAISVAIHVVVISALATITFHYPLAGIFTKAEAPTQVPVRYVALKPRAPAGAPQKTTARATPPAPAMPTVTSIPVGVPAPAAPVSPAPVATAIGAAGSTGVAGNDPGFGLRPGIPDGRLATSPAATPRLPETEGQKAERVLSAIYQEYLDSVRAQTNGRKPGDLSFGGKDGDRWGWDENGIHVGGVTIPNIVLAALPIPITPGTEPIAARTRDYIRNDIDAHARVMSQDEFKAAVRRVRERVDRERRERMEKAGKKKDPPCCG
jgi:hypothetical protein